MALSFVKETTSLLWNIAVIKEYLRKSINSCSNFSHECIFFAKMYILKVGYFKERAGTLIYFLNKIKSDIVIL